MAMTVSVSARPTTAAAPRTAAPSCRRHSAAAVSPHPIINSRATPLRTSTFTGVGSRSLASPRVAYAAPSARRVAAGAVRAEVSYVMVKPDGVHRGLVGEVIGRFERKGFKLVGLKMFQCSKELAEEHYKDLSSKPFFPDLVDYICSGPVVAMVWEGKGVVKSARKLIGATNPLESEPGTIRGDFAIEVGRNVIHGSDSPENGEREAALWFGGEAMCEWSPAMTPWLVEEGRE